MNKYMNCKYIFALALICLILSDILLGKTGVQGLGQFIFNNILFVLVGFTFLFFASNKKRRPNLSKTLKIFYNVIAFIFLGYGICRSVFIAKDLISGPVEISLEKSQLNLDKSDIISFTYNNSSFELFIESEDFDNIKASSNDDSFTITFWKMSRILDSIK